LGGPGLEIVATAVSKKGATIAGADEPEKLNFIFGPRNWLKMYPFFERAAVDEKQIQNEK